jgi:hypothetical protein
MKRKIVRATLLIVSLATACVGLAPGSAGG